MWEDSAIKAWDWAEKLYGSAEERDAYYASVLGIPELAAQQQFVSGTPWTSGTVAKGIRSVEVQARRSPPRPGPWSTNTFLDNCEALNRAADLDAHQCRGIACSGSPARTTIGRRSSGASAIPTATPTTFGLMRSPASRLAAWEYAETPGVNEQARNVIRNQFTACHTRIEAGVEHYSGPVKAPCRTMMVADGSLWNMGGQGIDVSGVHWGLIANHLVSGDPRALAILQDGMGFIYGANPLSMSFVAQVGQPLAGHHLPR